MVTPAFPISSSKRLKGVEQSKKRREKSERERAPESLQTVPLTLQLTCEEFLEAVEGELLEEFKEDSPQHSPQGPGIVTIPTSQSKNLNVHKMLGRALRSGKK